MNYKNAVFTLALLFSSSLQANEPPQATAGEGACLSAQLIYALEGRPTPQCHASTIVETPSGFVAAWFGGTREKNPDVGIWVSRQVNGEWSTPVEVVNGSENEDQDYAC